MCFLERRKPNPVVDPGATAGSEPTSTDVALAKAGEELGPQYTAKRLRESAQWLFSTVAVIGTALTAFGVLDPTSFADRLPLVLPAIGLTLLSLGLAGWALVPASAKVNLDDLESVRAYYDEDSKKRGWKVQGATILFVLALLLTAVPIAASAIDEAEPSAQIVASSAKGSKPALNVAVKATGLPKDAVADIVVSEAAAPVARVGAVADDSGELSAKMAVTLTAWDAKTKVTLTVRDGQDTILERETAVGPE